MLLTSFTTVALVMGSAGLRGTIPEHFTALDNLAVLDFGENALTGTLPTNLLGLSNLDIVRLRTNKISGEVAVRGFTVPACLDVSDNDISSVSEDQCPAIFGDNSVLITTCDSDQCDCCTCVDQVDDVCRDFMIAFILNRFS